MISEEKMIEAITEVFGATGNRHALVGIGDDCAVLPAASVKSLLSVDMLVEGVHFDLSYSSLAEVGAKSVAVAASDVAAMGGEAKWLLVSLGVPEKICSIDDISALCRGMRVRADAYNIQVVGGNVTRTKSDWVVDITVGGNAWKPVLRSGAQAGDVIGVTGPLGLAAAGLEVLRSGRQGEAGWKRLCEAQVSPKARLDFSSETVRRGISLHSMIDVSDGLSTDLNHLMKASSKRALVNKEWLPRDPDVVAWCGEGKRSWDSYVLHGGEDYELLLTCASSDWVKLQMMCSEYGWAPFAIGEVTEGEGVVLLDGNTATPLPAAGWDPFRRS